VKRRPTTYHIWPALRNFAIYLQSAVVCVLSAPQSVVWVNFLWIPSANQVFVFAFNSLRQRLSNGVTRTKGTQKCSKGNTIFLNVFMMKY